MKKLFWALFITMSLLLAGIFTSAPADIPEQPRIVEQEPEPEPEQPTVEELLRLVNEERAKVGVKPLKLNPLLNKSAQLKADDMVKRDYFAHEVKGTDNMLTPEMAKYAFANNQCDAVSENIFRAGGNKRETAVDGWMNSKPHREAMQSERYKSIGFGIKDWRVVAHFCDEG